MHARRCRCLRKCDAGDHGVAHTARGCVSTAAAVDAVGRRRASPAGEEEAEGARSPRLVPFTAADRAHLTALGLLADFFGGSASGHRPGCCGFDKVACSWRGRRHVDFISVRHAALPRSAIAGHRRLHLSTSLTGPCQDLSHRYRRDHSVLPRWAVGLLSPHRGALSLVEHGRSHCRQLLFPDIDGAWPHLRAAHAQGVGMSLPPP